MNNDNPRTPGFESMLLLFSADREDAGEKYEQMRRGLERYFRVKGCYDPLVLVDLTFERVSERIEKFDTTRNIKLSTYFYGFASNILLEHMRERQREIPLSETGQLVQPADDHDHEERARCFKKCLDRLPADDREVVIRYFTFRGAEKAELRRQMCADLGCTLSALQTRIFRIKSVLRRCIEGDLEKDKKKPVRFL